MHVPISTKAKHVLKAQYIYINTKYILNAFGGIKHHSIYNKPRQRCNYKTRSKKGFVYQTYYI